MAAYRGATTALVVVVLTTAWISGVAAQLTGNTDHINNIEDMFDQWRRRQLKFYGPSTYINLSIEFYLEQLIGLNTERQTLLTAFLITATWNDPRLVQNVSSAVWANNHFIKVAGELIWLPVICIQNEKTAHKSNNALLEGHLKPVKITRSGTVTAFNMIVAETHCLLNMRNFPFDQHKCKITIDSKTLDVAEHEIAMTPTAALYEEFYEDNSAWTIVELSISREGDAADVHIILQRKPNFPMLFLTFPIFLLACLSMMQYTISTKCGPVVRISLGVTCILALTVFLTMLKKEHPETEELSVLSIYMGYNTFIMMINLLISIIISNYAQNSSGRDWKATNPPACAIRLGLVYYKLIGTKTQYSRLLGIVQKMNQKNCPAQTEMMSLVDGEVTANVTAAESARCPPQMCTLSEADANCIRYMIVEMINNLIGFGLLVVHILSSVQLILLPYINSLLKSSDVLPDVK